MGMGSTMEGRPNKCCFTVFTLDPAEMGGKVQPTLTLGPDALAYEQYPTFLGITLDGALTFTHHADKVRKKCDRGGTA